MCNEENEDGVVFPSGAKHPFSDCHASHEETLFVDCERQDFRTDVEAIPSGNTYIKQELYVVENPDNPDETVTYTKEYPPRKKR